MISRLFISRTTWYQASLLVEQCMAFSISGMLSSFNRYQSLIVCACVRTYARACVLFNVEICEFIVEIKRKKLTSQTDTKLMDMNDRYRLRDDNSPDMEKGMHCSIYKEDWYHVIRILPRYLLISLWHFRCYVWEKLTLLLINMK